jgi:polyisoprenoid-binding protein YceI
VTTAIVTWTAVLAVLALISATATYRLDPTQHPTRAARIAHIAVTAWVVIGMAAWIIYLEWSSR